MANSLCIRNPQLAALIKKLRNMIISVFIFVLKMNRKFNFGFRNACNDGVYKIIIFVISIIIFCVITEIDHIELIMNIWFP